MRERKRVKVEEAEVPMSSMIDVVFLLLIYFIVVQKPIIEQTLLKTDLPTPGPVITIRPNTLRIDVFKQSQDDGYHYYGMRGVWWKDEQLFAQLEKISQNDPDTTVVINCGPNARHEKLITLLDACAKAELENLNIVNDASIPFKRKR